MAATHSSDTMVDFQQTTISQKIQLFLHLYHFKLRHFHKYVFYILPASVFNCLFHFFAFGATAPIWALAYLHATLRFTSVYYILDIR
jgi:hypothetical protein